MIQLIKKILGIGPAIDYSALLNSGATIIDVRTKGSVNIPLNNLSNHYSKINKDRPVITCCASGMRSASAKSLLKSNGFTEVHNGGGWQSLQAKIRK